MTEEEFVMMPACLANHRPLLWLALESAASHQGHVLELGTGHGSTPLLSRYCKDTGGYLLSVDNDPVWANQFSEIADEHHRVLCGDWDSPVVTEALFSRHWDVVLIDHAPGERRPHDMMRLRDRVKIFVCHDTEAHEASGYGDVWKNFLYRCDINPSTPEQRKANATAVSNSVDVTRWKGREIGGYTVV